MVTQECWWFPRAIGPWPESPRTARPHRGMSHLFARCPGELVDTAVPRKRARVARESGSKPRAFRARPKAARTAGRARGHWNPGPGRPGFLVDPEGPGTWARVNRACWSTPRGLRPERNLPGMPVETACHRRRGNPARTGGRPRGHWNPGPGRPGYMVDPVGPATRARVARDRWWTTRALGHWPESPGTAD